MTQATVFLWYLCSFKPGSSTLGCVSDCGWVCRNAFASILNPDSSVPVWGASGSHAFSLIYGVTDPGQNIAKLALCFDKTLWLKLHMKNKEG